MKKTFKELQEVDQVVAKLYEKYPELRQTKFGYAYTKFLKSKDYEEISKEFNEELVSVRIDNALEDEKTKEVIIDKENPRGFKFSKQGLKKCLEAEKKIIEEFYPKEVEVEPYLSSYIPDIGDGDKELLKGLIL